MLPADPEVRPHSLPVPDHDPLQIVVEGATSNLPDPEPAVAGPAAAKAAAAEPPAAEPPAAEPRGAEPRGAEPPGAEPPGAEPPGAEPAGGESAGGESAEQAEDTVVLAKTVRPRAPVGPEPGPAQAAPLPSWPQVLATTIRLWAQRRRRPPSAPGRRGRIIAVILVAILLVGGAVTAALARKAASGRGQAGTSALGTVATVRRQAATWVARQVAADAIVACDPAMCSVLQGQGIAASRLLVLRSGNADPLGSDVVMATAAVRTQFGSRLASVYAPEVLASFGQGSARIVIRAVAPDGAVAYQAALRADLQARTLVGRQLLGNPRLHVSASARQQLAAGEVDSRLLTTLATLAALYPIDVAGFGGSSPQASAGVPLRSADISGAPGVGGTRSAASLASLKGFLLAQRAPYLPAEVNTVRLATGQAVLRVEFTAPSPLGLLGAGG